MSKPCVNEAESIEGDLEKGQISEQPQPKIPRTKSWRQAKRRTTLQNALGLDSVADALPEHRLRRDVLPREGHVFALDEETIFRETQQHISYTWNGTTLTGLKKYLDCTEYGVTEIAEQELLRLEVRRLINDAKADGPMLLDFKGHLNMTSDEGFTELANVADQIKCNCEIIRLDYACISLEHCEGDADHTVAQFRNARRRLMGRFNNDQTKVSGSEPKFLSPSERNQEVYFTLVDFITSCIARLIVRVASSNYWHRFVFSNLAAWSTKLKVLSYDPTRFAKFSIETAEHCIEQLGQSFASKQAMFIKIRLNSDSKAEDVDTLDTETDISGRYHEEKTYFNKHIRNFFKSVLSDLCEPNEQHSMPGCFETCALVYKAGLDGALTTLSCDRAGGISASSDPFRLKCSYTALELVKRNLDAVESSLNTVPPTHAAVQGPKVQLKWEWSESEDPKDDQRRTTTTGDIGHVFSVVVPLSLASTFSTNTLDALVYLAGSATDDEDPILQFEPPSRDFGALVTVSTANWTIKDHTLSHSKYRDEEIRTLPKCPLRHAIRAGTNSFRRLTDHDTLATDTSKDSTAKTMQRYHQEKALMDSWLIAANSITIKCPGFVRAIIALALLIVCGGMAVPFSVGGRIRGVDPFQITTFAWVLAGFITIAAKAKYVSEWPWHDFLKGRVVCNRLTDVVDVTGLDPQIVLAYLLVEEQNTTLRTKGPYNGMFARRTDDFDGFAIDEAAHTSTMLASGFVLLKVLNEFGEHLICLDVRKGTKGLAPWLYETDEYLACMDLENLKDTRASRKALQQHRKAQKDQKGDHARNVGKVLKLSKVKVRINRILGVYIGDSRFG